VPVGKVLRVEECAYTIIGLPGNPIAIPNAPTNWWWNIRIGDKIQINNAGRAYTVVGPLTVFPGNPNTPNQNPELFVNDGPPGAASSIVRGYANGTGTITANVEFLYVVNGQDDDGDGYIDDGFDGVNNDYINGTDDVVQRFDGNNNLIGFGEWENEKWIGSLEVMNNPDNLKIYNNDPSNPGYNLPYTISRRPVVSPGSREIVLPGSVVIDATTWITKDGSPNPTSERSRLPIDPYSLTVDILVDPSGQIVPTTLYSSSSAFPITESFYHFWITDRTDVYDPLQSPFPALPMPAGAIPGATVKLKKERQLVTLFTKTGQIVTKSIETFHGPLLLGAGDPGDVNAPFYESQLGIREVK
jgi:hypothetical protein